MLVRSFALTIAVAALALVVLGVASLASDSPTPASAVAMPQKADINCDGLIDIKDMSDLLSYVGGGSPPPVTACTTVTLGVTGDPVFGDIDCSGAINLKDVLILLKYFAIPGIFGKAGEPAPDCAWLESPFPPEPSAYLIGLILSNASGNCIGANPGQAITATIYIRAIPASRPIKSFSLDLKFTSGMRIDSLNYQQLLASSAGSGPLVSASDAVPVAAGTYHISVTDPSMSFESGSGTLAILQTTVTSGSGVYIYASLENVVLTDSAGATLPVQLTGSGSIAVLPGVIACLPNTGGSPWPK